MNLIPILQKKYPAGTIGPGVAPFQGECVSFCHEFADFGSVGNTFQQKKKALNDMGGIVRANITEIGKGYRIGDLVITSDGVNMLGTGAGHMFMIADIQGDYLLAAESNFALPHRVTYGRKVKKDDKKIYGIIRAPLKFDLGQCEINYNVFVNNQHWNGWNFLSQIQADVLKWTNNKLKFNFFPLETKCENWWYEVEQFPLTGDSYKVIAKNYFDQVVLPYSYTSDNKPADLVAFIVRPDQWQGANFSKQSQLIGWTNAFTRPGQIQVSCAENDLSTWHYGMKLIYHGLIHEAGHWLAWVNGKDDFTDKIDLSEGHLEQVYNPFDFTRIKANL